MKPPQFGRFTAMQPSNFWMLALIPVAIVAFFTYLDRGFQLDDALIYLRYIRNVLDGNELTYNVGDSFNGLTSPLNSYLVLVLAWISKNYQLAAILLSGVFMTGACFVGGKIFARSTYEAIFTACVLGSTSYFYSTFGMETTLFLYLIGLSLYFYKVESSWFVITLALLLITRSEGVFLGAVLGVDYLLKHRRLPDLRVLLIAFLIISGPFVFNYLYYGAMLPATGSAKIGQGQSGLWGNDWIFLDLGYFIPWFLAGSKLAAALYIGLSIYGFGTEIRNRIAILALIFSGLLAAFYIGLNIPNYHWYYAPFVYLILIFACRGLWELLTLAVNTRAAPLIAISVLACTGFGYALTASVSLGERSGNQDYVEIGNWLKQNSASDASVAMVEIGTVGWYSERRIVDILGLVNDYNADYIGQRNFLGWLTRYQPDYILRHIPVWAHERSILAVEENGMYTPVENFPFVNFVLLRRAREVSAESIKQYASERTLSVANLRELEASTDLDSSFVAIDSSGLFAHAPNSLRLTVQEELSAIDARFGIREGAQGLHSEICFEIRLENGDESLMTQCIEADAPVEAMAQHKIVDASLSPGAQLVFEISCPVSCDYGWSYWSQVALRSSD